MPVTPIKIGTLPDSGTSESLKAALTKVNTNLALKLDPNGDGGGLVVTPTGASASDTLANLIASRAPLASPSLTGVVSVPTPALTAAAAPGDARGVALGLPYLLGLRNKTINVRRYANINAAASDIQDGFTLDIPAGDYNATGLFYFENKSIAIRGEGRGVSKIYFPAGSTGIQLVQDSYYRRVNMEGFSLYTLATDFTNTAIAIYRPAGRSSIEVGPTLRDIEITGADPSINTWAVGVDLKYCWNTTLENILVRHKAAAPYRGLGVFIQGQSTPVTARRCDIFFAESAFYAPYGAFNEGFIGQENQIVACTNGYFFDNSYDSSTGLTNAPLVEIRGGHSNTAAFGVRCVNRNSVKISGHTFYKRDDSTQNWVGVQLENACNASDITACNFFGYKGATPGGSATAVVLQGSIGCAVQHNCFQDLDTGVSLVDQPVLVTGNRVRNITNWCPNIPSGSSVSDWFQY